MPEFCSSGKPSAGRPASMSFPPCVRVLPRFRLLSPHPSTSFPAQPKARVLKLSVSFLCVFSFFKHTYHIDSFACEKEKHKGNVTSTELTETFLPCSSSVVVAVNIRGLQLALQQYERGGPHLLFLKV